MSANKMFYLLLPGVATLHWLGLLSEKTENDLFVIVGILCAVIALNLIDRLQARVTALEKKFEIDQSSD